MLFLWPFWPALQAAIFASTWAIFSALISRQYFRHSRVGNIYGARKYATFCAKVEPICIICLISCPPSTQLGRSLIKQLQNYYFAASVCVCVCVDSFQSIIGSLCSYQFTQPAVVAVAGQLKVDAENGERKINENPLWNSSEICCTFPHTHTHTLE